MRYDVPNFVSGLLCLPATYQLARNGSLLWMVVIVAALGVVGALVQTALASQSSMRIDLWQAPAAFILGALISEGLAFAYYYVEFDYNDPNLDVGIDLSLIEFGGIAVVGGVAACLATATYRRITIRWDGRD